MNNSEKCIIGYICYFEHDEEIAYFDEDLLINDYKESIYYRGVNAQCVKLVDKNNLNIRYRINNILLDEFGYEKISFEEFKLKLVL